MRLLRIMGFHCNSFFIFRNAQVCQKAKQQMKLKLETGRGWRGAEHANFET